MSNSSEFLGSQGKILDILEYIILKEGGVKIEEISDLFKLSKSGSFRILNILKNKGYLNYQKDKKSYCLSENFNYLSFKSIIKNPLIFIAEPILIKLSRKINEEILLLKIEDNKMKVIKRFSYLNNISFENDEFSVYASSFGKIILSFLNRVDREEIIKKLSITKYTYNTITSKNILIKELAKIRKDGFAISFEEYKIGYCDISFPLFDSKNKKIYSFGVILPKYKFTETNKNILIKELKSSKKKIESNLNKFHKLFT